MLGGKNIFPGFSEENQIQYQANASNQLQLFGNLPVGSSIDRANYFCNEKINRMLHPNKRSRENEDFSKQKLLFSLNYNEADRLARIRNQNIVSTGLRLSYDDDDEHNSSITSATGSMAALPSIILSLGDSVTTELDRQKEEFDKYMKIQEEHMVKGVREMKQKHIASFLDAVEKGVGKKVEEKELEIENIKRKNRELFEKIKQVAMDANNWCSKAKYNEAIVGVLKSKLEQAISHGAEHGREGFGESEEVDDAASYFQPGAVKLKHESGYEPMICRVCKAKEVSILLIPCRHLCLCYDCGGSERVCPVCHSIKTSWIQVYLS